MGLRAWIGMAQARRMFKRTARDLTGSNPIMKRKLMNRLVSKARDMTRRNITTQGLGTWAPLSKWTIAQTGRRKALITLRKFIVARRAKGKGRTASVIFLSPGDFTLTQHHDGYTDPARGGIVKIALKKPSALGLPTSASFKSFRDKRSRQVPARHVWPTGRRLFLMLRRETKIWAREMEQRLQRSR